AARGSDHPASLSALVALASAESASARAAGDAERSERAADVLAIAAQKASALMGPEHPQAVSATLALAAAEYEAATGSGSPRRVDDARELMAAAGERAGALLRDTGANTGGSRGAVDAGRPGVVGSARPTETAGRAEATERPTVHGAAPPAPVGDPTEAELALTRDQVRDALAPLPSRAPRAPVLWGRLGELSLREYVRGGEPHDLIAATEAFEVAFRTPGDTTPWHRWRLLYGHTKFLRHKISGGAGPLDEALELLTTGMASLPPGDDSGDGLRGLGFRLLAECSRRRYEYCRDHPGLWPELRPQDLLDLALRHHEAALAHVPLRTAESAAFIETLGRLHLERHRLFGETRIPATTGLAMPSDGDSATEGTWGALAAAAYAHGLIWRETHDEAHAAPADPAFAVLVSAPDALERLSPHVLDTLGRLAHHRGKARSDPATLKHAITLMDLAAQAWPDACQEERAASIDLQVQLRRDLFRARHGTRPDGADEGTRAVDLAELARELTTEPGLTASPVVLESFSWSAGREESGHARLSAAQVAALQAQSCLSEGDLATADHHLATATGIHAAFGADHPARLEMWLLLAHTGILRDSLAHRLGEEPTGHLIASPTPAQIRQGAARLSGARRIQLLGETAIHLLVGSGDGRFTEALALLREAYESLDSGDDAFLRYAYYLGSAECAAATARYDRAERDAGLDSGIDVLRRAAFAHPGGSSRRRRPTAAARSGGPGRKGWGSVMIALARAYRTRDARHLDDRAASLRAGLAAVQALATPVLGRDRPGHHSPGHDAVVARAVTAALEVAAWCCQDGELTEALYLLDLSRVLSLRGEPTGPPPAA
ncbi:hypothetical protein AB0I84_48090, partial [Streptomyces spectabilis]